MMDRLRNQAQVRAYPLPGAKGIPIRYPAQRFSGAGLEVAGADSAARAVVDRML